MRYIFLRKSIFFCALLLSYPAHADTVTSMNNMFEGHNIYGPNVMKDGIVYKMWYSAWQTGLEYPYDRIYYRYSYNNKNWSSYLISLNPWDISSSTQYEHLGDPSITKHYDSASGSWKYTMFYTACLSPCTQQSHNQIWSSTSNNGFNWSSHKLLLAGGVAEPSVIYEPSGNTKWKVYYTDRLNPFVVHLAHVNANRDIVGTPSTVYYHPSSVGGVISNVEVKYVNNKWQLFFVVIRGSGSSERWDIFKTVSTTNTSWPSSPEGIITNPIGGTICSTNTPAVRASGSNTYDLYFGQVRRHSDGSCNIQKHTSIEKWTVIDN